MTAAAGQTKRRSSPAAKVVSALPPADDAGVLRAFRRAAQQALADFGLDPAVARQMGPDQVNAAVRQVVGGADFDVRQLLRKEGWDDQTLAELDLRLAAAGLPLAMAAGELPPLAEHP